MVTFVSSQFHFRDRELSSQNILYIHNTAPISFYEIIGVTDVHDEQ